MGADRRLFFRRWLNGGPLVFLALAAACSIGFGGSVGIPTIKGRLF